MAQRIFIVDDHPLMRRGYASLVNEQVDLEVCGEAGSANEALSLIPERKPDLVLADITLDGMSGIDLLKHLVTMDPKLPVLMVSMHNESLYAERLLQAGARGYVMKSEDDDTLLKAIYRILQGGYYLSDRMNTRIMRQYSGRPVDHEASPLERLTDRELEVFEFFGRGYTTREVADAMHLSPKTVETYRGRLKEKLAIETTAELTQRAVLWVERNEQP